MNIPAPVKAKKRYIAKASMDYKSKEYHTLITQRKQQKNMGNA